MKYIVFLLAIVALVFASVDCTSGENCTIDTSDCVALQTTPTEDIEHYLCTIQLSYTMSGTVTEVSLSEFSISGATEGLADPWPSDYPKPTYWEGPGATDIYPVSSATSSYVAGDLETDPGTTTITVSYKTIVRRGNHICINTQYFAPEYRLAHISFDVDVDGTTTTYYENSALWSSGDIYPEDSSMSVFYQDETLTLPSLKDGDTIYLVEDVPTTFNFSLANPLGDAFDIADAAYFLGDILNQASDSSTTVYTQSDSSSESDYSMDKILDMISFRLYTCVDPADIPDFTDSSVEIAGCSDLFVFENSEMVVATCDDIISAFDSTTLEKWFGTSTPDCTLEANEEHVNEVISEIEIKTGEVVDFSITPPWALFTLALVNIPSSITLGLAMEVLDPIIGDNHTLTLIDTVISYTTIEDLNTNEIPQIESIKMVYDATYSKNPFVQVSYTEAIMYNHVDLDAMDAGEVFNCNEIMRDRIGLNTHSGSNTCQVVTHDDSTSALHIYPSFKGTNYSFPLYSFLTETDPIDSYKGLVSQGSTQNVLDFFFMDGASTAPNLRWVGYDNVNVVMSRTVDGEVITDKPLYASSGEYTNVLANVDENDWIDTTVDTWLATVNSALGDSFADSVSVVVEKGDGIYSSYTTFMIKFSNLPSELTSMALSTIPITLIAKIDGENYNIANFYDESRDKVVSSITLDPSKLVVNDDGDYVLYAFDTKNNDITEVTLIHPLLPTMKFGSTDFTTTHYEPNGNVCSASSLIITEVTPKFRVKCTRSTRTPSFQPISATYDYSVTYDGMDVENKYMTISNYADYSLIYVNAFKYFEDSEVETTASFKIEIDDDNTTTSFSLSVTVPTVEEVLTSLNAHYGIGYLRVTTRPEVDGTFYNNGTALNTSEASFYDFEMSSCQSIEISFTSDELTSNPDNFVVNMYPKILNGVSTTPTFAVKDAAGSTVTDTLTALEDYTVEITMPFAEITTAYSGCGSISTILQSPAFYVYTVEVVADGDVLSTSTLSNSSSETPAIITSIPDVAYEDNTSVTVNVYVGTKYAYMGTVALTSQTFTLTESDPVDLTNFETKFESALSKGSSEGYTPSTVLSIITTRAVTSMSTEDQAIMNAKKGQVLAKAVSDLKPEETASMIKQLQHQGENLSEALTQNQGNTIKNSITNQFKSIISSRPEEDDTGSSFSRYTSINKQFGSIPESYNALYQLGRGNVSTSSTGSVTVQTVADDLEDGSIDISTYAFDSEYVKFYNTLSTIAATAATLDTSIECSSEPSTAVDYTTDPQVTVSRFSPAATSVGISSISLPDSFYTAMSTTLPSSACVASSVVVTSKPTDSVYASTTIYSTDGKLEYGYLRSAVVSLGFSNSSDTDMNTLSSEISDKIEITLDTTENASQRACMLRLTTGSWSESGCTVSNSTSTSTTCSCPTNRVVRSSSTAVAVFSLDVSSSGGSSGGINFFSDNMGIITMGILGIALVLGVLGMVCGARSSKKKEKLKSIPLVEQE